VHLRIEDDGVESPGPEPRDGRGRVGVRERAAISGGSLSAGPSARGGFLVETDLRIPADERSP
jgi:signal transduction histidine kinase